MIELADLGSNRNPEEGLFADWHARAACVDYDPELWFSPRDEDERFAKSVCATCPVQAECRADIDAMEAESQVTPQFMSGIWAGENPRERLSRRSGKPILIRTAGRHGRFAWFTEEAMRTS